MTDVEVSDVVAALRTALAAGESEDEFDITVDDQTGAIECATDDWTLLIEGVPETPMAWLAIDDEPDDPYQFPRARRAVMSSAEEQALRRADAALDGLLGRALAASEDPFSQHMAAVLRGSRDSG